MNIGPLELRRTRGRDVRVMGAKSFCQLRNALGLSEDQFAKFVGEASETIVAIESGKIPVSSPLARKTFLKTGAMPFSIMAPDAEITAAKFVAGGDYTEASFKQWLLICMQEFFPKIVGGGGSDRLSRMIDCAQHHARVHHKAGQFQAGLAIALFQLIEELEIPGMVDAMIAEQRRANAEADVPRFAHSEDFWCTRQFSDFRGIRLWK